MPHHVMHFEYLFFGYFEESGFIGQRDLPKRTAPRIRFGNHFASARKEFFAALGVTERGYAPYSLHAIDVLEYVHRLRVKR